MKSQQPKNEHFVMYMAYSHYNQNHDILMLKYYQSDLNPYLKYQSKDTYKYPMLRQVDNNLNLLQRMSMHPIKNYYKLYYRVFHNLQ